MELHDSYVPLDDIEYIPPDGFVAYWNWKGRLNDPATVRTGQLASWLRDAVRLTTPLQRLTNAVLRRLDPLRAATAVSESNAFADLAVTGRRSLTAFSALRPTDASLRTAVLAAGAPARTATDTAVREVLDRAFSVLYATRGDPSHREHFRPGLGWIAVAGDEDSPHAPINVPCTRDHMGEMQVSVTGHAGVSVRAAIKVARPPADAALPELRSRTMNWSGRTFHDLITTRRAEHFDSLILFIHGLGSRLEESDEFKRLLIEQGLKRGHRYGILSIDLPGFGYSEQIDMEELKRIRVAPRGGFHGFKLPDGAGSNFPLLGYYRDLIATLSRQVTGGIQHVMGGSLGGNLSLWIAADPLFTLLRDDVARVQGLQSVAAWSPASIWASYGRARGQNDEELIGTALAAAGPALTTPMDPLTGISALMTIGLVEFFRALGETQEEGSRFNPLQHQAVVRAQGRMRMPEPAGRADFFTLMQRGEALVGVHILGAWGHPATPANLIQQAEIYSERMRRVFWTCAFEQIEYSHQEPLARAGEWPFRTIKLPLMLASGGDDVGTAGVMDIYNPCGMVSEQSPFVAGRRLLLAETSHSISDIHPPHLAREVDRFFVDAPGFALWERVAGAARDIGIGADGSVWVVGTDTPVAGNGGLYRWQGTAWVAQAGTYGTRIAVDTRGGRWVVNSRNEIWRPDGSRAPGSARDIGIGPEGTVYVIGTDTPAAGNGGVHRWSGTAWVRTDGWGTRVAVDASGGRWVLNNLGQIWGPTGAQVPGKASDIATGADGSVWVVGAEGADANGNFPIYRHAHGGWWHFGGKGVALAVEPSGRPWVVTGEGKIYRMTRLPAA